MKSIYLLIDIENVTTSKVEEQLKLLGIDLFNKGLSISKIGFASKNENLLKKWIQLCEKIFEVKKEDIISLKTPNGKEVADIALALIAGNIFSESKKYKNKIILISKDKGLGYIAQYMNSWGGDCEIRNLVTIKTKSNFVKEPIFIKTNYPFVYTSIDINVPMLQILEMPREIHPLPKVIPLADIGEELIIGKKNSDINLEYWDEIKKGSVYLKHASFFYRESELYFRSLKGFRRGKHSVTCNNKIISAQQGAILLKNNDIITVGKFKFQVKIPKKFSNRIVEIQKTDLPSRVANIEKMLHKWIQIELEKVSNNWWEELIDSNIQEACKIRMETSIEHPFNFTVLSELDKIITKNWDSFNKKILDTFPSKKKYKKAYSKYLRIRNKVMHPTRLEVSNEEIGFLNNYYHIIEEITAPNRVDG